MLTKETKSEGFDTSGAAVKLGDYDSDGHRVGYIDPGGLAHESHYEAEASQLECEFIEAYVRWRYGQGTKPDPVAMAEIVCSPENRQPALRQAYDGCCFWVTLRQEAGCWNPPGHVPDGVDPKGSWQG